MAKTLGHRGPDGSRVWTDGSVGLGHVMLRTTPESLSENLPLADESRAIAITADARIDNRDDLISNLWGSDTLTLHPSPRGMQGEGGKSDLTLKEPPGVITDSQIILRAYETWDEKCTDKLIGDFAFCIVDRRRHTMFCARDASGDRPFYYYLSDKVFVFGSEIRPLFSLPEVPRQLNETMVGDYLIGMFDDQSSTFFKGILRLPPGHSITIGPDWLRTRHYWSLDPDKELRLGSDDQYADAFREIFTEAVRCRLRSAYSVMSSLSGGLDSSSVTCVARDILTRSGDGQLPTVSLVYDGVPECDESDYINAVIALGGIEPHYFHGEQVGPLPYVDCDPWEHDDPFDAPSSYSASLGGLVSGLGVRITLDGIDGDTTVCLGHGYLPDLFRAGHWLELISETKALAGSLQCGFWGLLWRKAVKPLAPAGLRRTWRILSGRGERPWDRDTFINLDFAGRIGLRERFHALQAHRLGPPGNSRLMHWYEMTWGGIIHQIESMNKVSARFGIEVRHPFRDRRLMEFCLAIPPEQKLYRGLNRMVMRRAMADILPKQVLCRGNKVDFRPSISYWLLQLKRKQAEEAILGIGESMSEYIDVQALTAAYFQFRASPVETNLRYMLYASSLGQWLKRSKLAP
jgi:asparagine synthase (glutamine-hydrolysing)